MWNDAMAEYKERLPAVDQFNASNAFVKRGLSATTVKYGVSQQECQGSVGIFPDGSVICFHGTAEMGQV